MCVCRTEAITCYQAVLMLQFSRSGLRYSAPWEMLHSCSGSQICAGVHRVLGSEDCCPGSFISARSPYCRSISRKLETKISFRRLFFFFPFSVQAVSGLSIIVRVEQSVIFITHRFLFCTVLCRLHFHITGVILECKKDASLAVRTRAGERPPRTAPTLPLSHKIFFFLFLWGSVSLNVALETYSVTGLGQNLAVSFLNRVFSLLLVFTEIL